MRRRYEFPQLSAVQIIMWIVVVAPIVFIEFIWVPYRLEDGSVDWSWSWNPPRVIAEWDRKVFEQIRKEWR